MNPRSLRRLRFVALLGLIGFGTLLIRLAFIQVLGHGRLSREAQGQQTERMILEPERGRIYDRRMRSLADNVALSQISVRPAEVENAAATRRFIQVAVGSSGVDRLRRGRRKAYIRITSQLEPEREIALRKSALPAGVQVEEVPSRVYPLDQIGRPVVGVLGTEGAGLDGLEKVFDRELKGASGWVTLFRDGRGAAHQLPQSMVKLPEPGASLVTTLDRDLQSIALLKVKGAVQSTGSKRGMAVFADPQTGDILAMVTVEATPPTDGSIYRNRVIADQYEPGSTFKVLAGCAALEERVFAAGDSFFVNKGEIDMGGFTIHDSHPETAWLSVRMATAKSSNVCYAQIGTKVGAERLYRYARLFGFGQPTRIALPGEAPGQIRDPSRWSKRSLATISIGQEVMVTPLQLLMAYAAVANGGTLLRPRIATALLNEEGEPVRQFGIERVRRVISPETAATFRSFLRDAVTVGTATDAALPWCEVAGKTGTAQKLAENGHGYGDGRYISSFVGMAPADDPKVVGLVILDEPRGVYYGGQVAAPVVREILATWASLGRSPLPVPSQVIASGDAEAPVGARVPDVRLMVPAQAQAVLRSAGYACAIEGSGHRVAVQTPEPGIAARAGDRVTIVLTTSTVPETAFPDLRGMPLRDALRKLTALSIPVARIIGTGAVLHQLPAPGTPRRPSDSCVLTCAPRSL